MEETAGRRVKDFRIYFNITVRRIGHFQEKNKAREDFLNWINFVVISEYPSYVSRKLVHDSPQARGLGGGSGAWGLGAKSIPFER